MQREGTGFGFPTFAAYMPGSVYRGFARDNDWFLQHCSYEGISSSEDMARRTGTLRRSFAESHETILSIAQKCGAHFLHVLEGMGIARNRCRGVLLGTSAVGSDVLGLQTADLVAINEDDISQLVQRTALRVAQMLDLEDERSCGHNYACSSTTKLTEVGIGQGRDLQDGEFFLMMMAEKLGAMIDLRDRKTGFLFGDCCSVTALKRGETRFKILDVFSDTMSSDSLITLEERSALGPDGKEYVHRKCLRMERGGEVLQTASREMIDLVAQSLQRLGLQPSDVTEVVPHQANVRFVRPMQSEWKQRQWGKPPPVDINTSTSGNTGSASWMRRMAERQQSLKRGSIIMAPFVGAGPNLDPLRLSTGNITLEVGE